MASSRAITATIAASAVKDEPKKQHSGGSTTHAWTDGYTMLYWSIPFPRGATIVSAKLTLHIADAWNGSKTTWLQRLTQAWSASKMTWDNKPGLGAVLYKGTPSGKKNAAFAFDIKALMQGVADGTPWYGVGFRSNHNALHRIWSETAPNTAMRPRIDIVWSVNPDQPSGLSPHSGMIVNLAKPRLIWGYTDRDGNTTMTQFRVQIANNSAMTSGLWDSAAIASKAPIVDLAKTSYPGIAEGATIYWRVQNRDDVGLWSPWSAVTSFKRVGHGTTTITVPGDRTTDYVMNSVPGAYGGAGVDATRAWGGGSGAGTYSIEEELNPSGSPDFYRKKWTTGGTSTASTGFDVDGFTIPVVNNDNLYIGAWMRNNSATVKQAVTQLTYSDASTSIASTPTVALDPGEWTWVTMTVKATKTSNVTKMPLDIASGGTAWAPGDSLDVVGVVITKNDPLDEPYQVRKQGLENYFTQIQVIRNPAPVINWTFAPPAGFSQAQWRVVVTEDMFDQVIHDTGPIVGPETSYQLPYGLLNDKNTTYTIQVRVLDSVPDRATVGGDSAWRSDSVTVKYSDVGTGAIAAISDLAVTGQEGNPNWKLTWHSSESTILYFLIYRYSQVLDEEVLVETVPRAAALIEGTTNSFQYTDNFVPGRSQYTWHVQIVTANDSSMSNGVSAFVKNRYPWLIPYIDDGVDRKVAMLNASIEPALSEITDVVEPLEGDPMLIAQKYGGFAGTGEGRLVNDIVVGYTAQQFKQNFLWMRENPLVYLLWSDETILCYIYNCSYKPISMPTGKTEYTISFNFVQVTEP